MDAKLTIDDIAKALGVSKTTVSRVISGKGRIGAETAKRVQDYIAEHNFKPNAMAQGLASQRTYNIGVVWPGDCELVDMPYFQRCLVGMNDSASRMGYDIMVSLVTGKDFTNIKRLVSNHKVDGVILTRTMKEDVLANYLKTTGIPFVVIGKSLDESLVQIDNDNYTACKEMTNVMLSKGLKKLALIGGSKHHMITQVRYEGFQDAFKSNGLEVQDDLIYLDADDSNSINNAIEDCIRKQVDGIICMDDAIAGKTLERCRSEKIHIPDKVKLASFYNSSLLENSNPSVTSLNFDDRKLGSVAAKTLIDMIEGNEGKSVTLKQYEVSLRESTK